ncbi:hypothetical protein ACF3NT_08210 [Naumannella halotolerans]|uniref:hypothetical protein n=1 Tax=Naumannella halotolerans TaxID=993414 RepID=UPI00370DCB69
MRELSAAQLIIDQTPVVIDSEAVAAAAGVRLALRGLVVDGQFRPAGRWDIRADVDEVECRTEIDGIGVEQRHGADGIWNWRIRLANRRQTATRVAAVLDIEATDGWQRRSWLAGADGLIVNLPPRGIGPVWSLRPRLGTLQLNDPTASTTPMAGTEAAVIMDARELTPGEQHVVLWRAERLPDPAAAARGLPRWLPRRLELEPGAALELDLPDAALVHHGEAPGVQQVLVHQGTGTTELTLSLPYRLDELIEAVASATEQTGVRSDEGRIAEALVLLHASARGAHPDAVALAEETAQRLPPTDPLAVITAATGASTAGWYDGVVPAEFAAAAQTMTGPGGDLARMHVRGAALLLGEATPAPPRMATSPEQVLLRLGAGLPGESDGLSPAEVGELLAWAATQPDEVWAQLGPAGGTGDQLADLPGSILDRAESWALARLRPQAPFSVEDLRAIAWLAIHQQLVRG